VYACPLLQNMTSASVVGSVEETPLASACARGYRDIAELLIYSGANINYLCSVRSDLLFLFHIIFSEKIYCNTLVFVHSICTILLHHPTGPSPPSWVCYNMQAGAHAQISS